MIAFVPVGQTPDSVHRTHLERMHPDFRRVLTPSEAEGASLVVIASHLPFEGAVGWLKAQGWWRELPGLLSGGLAVLGLEGAMHVLAEGSEEAPRLSGLGLLPGLARRLGPRVKVPHLGWSPVRSVASHPALPEAKGLWLNFAHAYALDVDGSTLWEGRHGRPFSVASARGRVLGLQADLAGSGAGGLTLMANLRAWGAAQGVKSL